MRVKICGLTRLEDALAATKLGSWAIGFVFYEKSPRYIKPPVAAGICKALSNAFQERPLRVGVFVNESQSNVLNIARTVGLTGIQLHGDESPAFCQRVSENFSGITIKAVQGKHFENFEPYMGLPQVQLLIDAVAGSDRGGTGKLANWNLALKVSQNRPLILSGGIHPRNIRSAMSTVNPFAIDLSSGVEKRPGIKSKEKLVQLFQNISRYDYVQ